MELLAEIRRKKPLVHCISNIVTANDCANLLLAVGASPIMAQAPEEMPEISGMAQAVVLNTGTPSEEKFCACISAGATANQHRIPVVLDPVGVGASPWRLNHIHTLLEKVHPDIVRVNYSEAKALLGKSAGEQGVDSVASGLESRAELSEKLARRLNTVVLLTGTEDVISDGSRTRCISGGSDRMRQITGAGCMLSVLCGGFAAVTGDPFEATCAAANFWKETAQKAEEKTKEMGLGSYHTALFDAASQA